MRVNMQDLKRPILSVDSSKEAALPGQPIVLMGYATGIAAILARADDATAEQIMTRSDGDISQVMDELARRKLIRPIITQGHIGDVLPDKIVFDAQTTNGGSGGPLFNRQGKVIGVTYAVLNGFGGSNFRDPDPIVPFACRPAVIDLSASQPCPIVTLHMPAKAFALLNSTLAMRHS